MGRYVSDYIKNKERQKGVDRLRSKRRQEDKATDKQIGFIVDLGRQLCMDDATTLTWVIGHVVWRDIQNEVTCFMDLTRAEASKAIGILKAKLDD